MVLRWPVAVPYAVAALPCDATLNQLLATYGFAETDLCRLLSALEAYGRCWR